MDNDKESFINGLKKYMVENINAPLNDIEKTFLNSWGYTNYCEYYGQVIEDHLKNGFLTKPEYDDLMYHRAKVV